MLTPSFFEVPEEELHELPLTFLTRKSGNDRCGRLQSSLLRADTLALHTCGVTRRTERKKRAVSRKDAFGTSESIFSVERRRRGCACPFTVRWRPVGGEFVL